MAFGVGRRSIDFGGADGLYAGRDRLAESATELATAERALIQENLRLLAFCGSPIASNL
ncbi:hypothetical protein [Bradyrhizobium centrosematis]|uniref:hypothetical protein n=1 Tax=Bradyrhizobium centrosematis TaxID=1300039 RepID=UPI00388E9C43